MTRATVKYKKQQVDQKCLQINQPTKEFDFNDKQDSLTINFKNIFLDLFANTNDRTFTAVITYQKDGKHKCTSTFTFSLPIIPHQM